MYLSGAHPARLEATKPKMSGCLRKHHFTRVSAPRSVPSRLRSNQVLGAQRVIQGPASRGDTTCVRQARLLQLCCDRVSKNMQMCSQNEKQQRCFNSYHQPWPPTSCTLECCSSDYHQGPLCSLKGVAAFYGGVLSRFQVRRNVLQYPVSIQTVGTRILNHRDNSIRVVTVTRT